MERLGCRFGVSLVLPETGIITRTRPVFRCCKYSVACIEWVGSYEFGAGSKIRLFGFVLSLSRNIIQSF